MDYTWQHIQNWIPKVVRGIIDSITQPETIIQLTIVLLCVVLGLIAGIAVKKIFKSKIKISDKTYPVVKKLLEVTLQQAPFIFVVILVFICQTAMQQLKYPALILYLVGILIATRVLIKIIKFLVHVKIAQETRICNGGFYMKYFIIIDPYFYKFVFEYLPKNNKTISFGV